MKISSPTYVSKHPKSGSIEFIKKYKEEGDLVLVAIRASGKGVLFVRTLFIISERKIRAYLKSKTLKKY